MSDLFQNLTGEDHCPWCCDEAMVPVGVEVRKKYRWTPKENLSVDTGETYREEIYGPCPACERGAMSEFPPGKRGPWGFDGFWRGKPWRDFGLVKQCMCRVQRGSEKELRQWMEHIRSMLAAVGAPTAVATAPVQSRDALLAVGPASDDPPPTTDSTGPHADAVESTPPAENDAPSAGTVPVSASDRHECPHFKKVVPFSADECALCNPPDPNEDKDVIPF